MDEKTYLGSLGEAKTIAVLTEQKFFVFNQLSGKAPFDLIAVKDNCLYRINVKTCNTKDKYGSYLVQIGRVRSNKKENIIHKFDKTSCDFVAVYLPELDKVCFIPSKKISSGRTINLRIEASKSSNKPSFVIDKFLNLED